MKKFFTFAMALMAAVAINATDYYFAGAANGWSNNNEKYKFVEVDGVLTLEVEDLYGEFKITENGSWHPQHGAAAKGEGVALNGKYTLVKCVDTEENPQADAPANASILIPENKEEGDDFRYKNAKLTLDVTKPDAVVISLVAGTVYDHNAAPKTYQIVGAFNGWKADEAPSFEEVDGVLTVTIENLSGTFKVIQDHAWTNQWATNWDTKAGLALGTPYEMGPKKDGKEPDNLALANPFGGYKNAKLTLKIDGEKMILTLVSGEFELTKNDWFVPGSLLGWNCNDATKMSPVEGKDNTYELLVAEFKGEFKVVYGDWAVEFGAPKGETGDWTINTPLELAFPCDNMKPADPDAVYQDVTLTLVVDYEKVAATLTIGVEESKGIETISSDPLVTVKKIQNGQLLIERNGVLYNMTGAKQ